MLREVHGGPQLHLPQAEDAGPVRHHHCRVKLSARIPVRGGQLRARLDDLGVRAARADQDGDSQEPLDSNRKVGSFEPAEGVKEIPLDPQGSGEQKLRVGSTLTPK